MKYTRICFSEVLIHLLSVPVHVSPDGKDFVAITQVGIAYFVPNFERVMRGEASFSETALSIKFDGAATNLSFEYDRVVITTVY